MHSRFTPSKDTFGFGCFNISSHDLNSLLYSYTPEIIAPATKYNIYKYFDQLNFDILKTLLYFI